MFATESTSPVVVLDTTTDGPQSSMVKKVTRQLKIPTLTTSYGHLGDIIEWKDLSPTEKEYLVQIMPPTDIIGQIVHDVGASQNLTTAGILYDDGFYMKHRYKSILVNLPVRQIMQKVNYKKPRRADYDVQTERDSIDQEALKKIVYVHNFRPEADSIFHFELVKFVATSVASEMKKDIWTPVKPLTCDGTSTGNGDIFQLKSSLNMFLHDTPYGKIILNDNGKSYLELQLKLDEYSISNTSMHVHSVGTWTAGLPGVFKYNRDDSLSKYIAKKIYRIVTVETAPFIMKIKNPDGSVSFDGYCIDLLHEIREIVNFEYEIYEVPDGAYGAVNEKGEWNGLIKELIDKVKKLIKQNQCVNNTNRVERFNAVLELISGEKFDILGPVLVLPFSTPTNGGVLAVSRYHQLRHFFPDPDLPVYPDHDFPTPNSKMKPSAYLVLKPKNAPPARSSRSLSTLRNERSCTNDFYRRSRSFEPASLELDTAFVKDKRGRLRLEFPRTGVFYAYCRTNMFHAMIAQIHVSDLHQILTENNVVSDKSGISIIGDNGPDYASKSHKLFLNFGRLFRDHHLDFLLLISLELHKYHSKILFQKADIALAPISVMAEREHVVDFTVPYYDLVGITILMKKPKPPTSLFKFLNVLETEVWLCILAAYFITSILMFLFDRWSPYSLRNNKEMNKNDDDECRQFNIKECLWFCMTSLTPQGGGEAPKNLSGRFVAATWWLFGFIVIASYTANLAAFLTVSRLDSSITSLDDLAKQYKFQYAPSVGTATMTYFQRMADIEEKFYEIWKDMSLNESMDEVERAKLAVWDYPVSDRYTRMWNAIKQAGLPRDYAEGIERIRTSDFAYIGDATEIKWAMTTECDFQPVGDEFSRKPYAIAVQKDSPLRDQFSGAIRFLHTADSTIVRFQALLNCDLKRVGEEFSRKPLAIAIQKGSSLKNILSTSILQLLNIRTLETLKEKWWDKNPLRKDCDSSENMSDGISIANIGELFQQLHLQEPAPQKVLFTEDPPYTAVVIDFMAYARKVAVTKLKLKTFGDMAAQLWNTFSAMASTCKRIDVVFDVYEAGSIIDFERLRRSTVDPIEVSINRSDTPLPIDLGRLWASISNKSKFEAFFIRWITEQIQGMVNMSIPVFLGGAHETDMYKCIRLDFLNAEDVPQLRCTHQEADDRLLLHIQHATCAESFKRVIVASADTDVFICFLYHFNQTWHDSGFNELWVLVGQGNTSRAIPIHDLAVEMPSILVSVLPAVHALTGCDTTSKVSTKYAAFKVAEQGGSDLIKDFGKLELTNDMEHRAETFLSSAVAGFKFDTMDQIRYFQYHHKGIKNNFVELAPTSSSIALHIKRAYLQCYQWVNATYMNIQTLNPLDHGHELQDDLLVPTVVSEPTIPGDFPHLCGVFIVIFIGIGFASFALVFEYFYYRRQRSGIFTQSNNCYVKTGITEGKATYGKSFYVCSKGPAACNFQTTARVPASFCDIHKEIIELKSVVNHHSGERRIYFRCKKSYLDVQKQWCGHEVLATIDVSRQNSFPEEPVKSMDHLKTFGNIQSNVRPSNKENNFSNVLQNESTLHTSNPIAANSERGYYGKSKGPNSSYESLSDRSENLNSPTLSEQNICQGLQATNLSTDVRKEEANDLIELDESLSENEKMHHVPETETRKCSPSTKDIDMDEIILASDESFSSSYEANDEAEVSSDIVLESSLEEENIVNKNLLISKPSNNNDSFRFHRSTNQIEISSDDNSDSDDEIQELPPKLRPAENSNVLNPTKNSGIEREDLSRLNCTKKPESSTVEVHQLNSDDDDVTIIGEISNENIGNETSSSSSFVSISSPESTTTSSLCTNKTVCDFLEKDSKTFYEIKSKVSSLNSRLQSKQLLTRSINMNALPDKGEKIISNISALEKEIAEYNAWLSENKSLADESTGIGNWEKNLENQYKVNSMKNSFISRLQSKKLLLRTVDLHTLPDQGEKIKSDIASLEKQLMLCHKWLKECNALSQNRSIAQPNQPSSGPSNSTKNKFDNQEFKPPRTYSKNDSSVDDKKKILDKQTKFFDQAVPLNQQRHLFQAMYSGEDYLNNINFLFAKLHVSFENSYIVLAVTH
ncbi:Ionotropic receptor 25a [Nymphon striatum]|nr:Ionotropic receptor 25a [Nymphon striatum]